MFTGRPWRRGAPVDETVLAAMRRKVPLDVPVSDCLLRVLAARGVTGTHALEGFFYPSLDQLHDPFELAEMDHAVERVRQAARDGERVAVHGDFDVDGITGSALLYETFCALTVDGSQVRCEPAFIPDRATDGYGVAGRMVREWADRGVTLLVTVDTGSAALAEIGLARDLGLDVIVLDHHIFEERPRATALVNPRRDGAAYPNPDLCGVAVAFKLAQALRQADPASLPDEFLTSVLDLVAMGLVADQMALVAIKAGAESSDSAAIKEVLASRNVEQVLVVTGANDALNAAILERALLDGKGRIQGGRVAFVGSPEYTDSLRRVAEESGVQIDFFR